MMTILKKYKQRFALCPNFEKGTLMLIPIRV